MIRLRDISTVAARGYGKRKQIKVRRPKMVGEGLQGLTEQVILEPRLKIAYVQINIRNYSKTVFKAMYSKLRNSKAISWS